MSKITNEGLTRSGAGCFINVPVWQQWASKSSQQSTVQASVTAADDAGDEDGGDNGADFSCSTYINMSPFPLTFT